MNIHEFLQDCSGRVLLDVRSPGEYARGHIPGAISFPLFTDAERALVGTSYKQQGREQAMELGLELVGPKMAGFIREARTLAPQRRLAVHCWRGGQRSGSMAWLFRQAGFDVITLQGGYKAYRRRVLEGFEKVSLTLLVVGGKTGSGKTKILQELARLGEQVVDLEWLARHKGSAFGNIGEPCQPTVEQFENDLLEALCSLDPQRRVWIENESHSIGRVYVPMPFWKKMRTSTLFNLVIPEDTRIKNLLHDYVLTDKSQLEAAFLRIHKKLGGQHLKTALEALAVQDFATAARIALHYYDKTYQHGLDNNPSTDIRMLEYEHGDPVRIAEDLLVHALKVAKSASHAPAIPHTP